MSSRSDPFHKVDFFGALLSGFSFIGLNILLQIVLIPLYVQSLGKANFGVLMIILSSLNFLTFGVYGLTGQVLRNLSIHAANQAYPQFTASYTRARSIFGLYAVIVALGGLVLFLAIYGLGDIGAGKPGESLPLAALFGAAYLVTNIDLGTARIGLAALHRQTAANILHAISAAVFGALVIPWMLLGGGVAGVTGAMFFGALIARFAAALYIRKRDLPARWTAGKRLFSSAVHEYGGKSSQLYLIYGAIFIMAHSDAVILGLMSHPETVADFILLWKVAEVLLLVLSRIPEHLQPIFARLNGDEHIDAMGNLYARSMFWLRIAALCAGVCYAALGPWIVTAWVGQSAAPQEHLGYILAGSALFWIAVARIPTALANLRGGEPQRILIKLSATDLLLKIIAMLVLIPFVGAYAPLIAINLLHLGGYHFFYARLSPHHGEPKSAS